MNLEEFMKTVIVTGSTSGIGLGIAESFAQAGNRLVLNGIESPDETKDLVSKVKALSGTEVIYSDADLSTVSGCHALVDQTLERFGGVDIVVNNAGIQHKALVQEFPEEKWRKVLALNLEAAFYIAQRVLPHMYKQKWGRLIHISSAHGLVASTQKAAYVAAKHGLMGLSKVIALEAAGQGVTSNCICPGWTLTPLVEKQISGIADHDHCSFEKAKTSLLSEKQPSKQFVTSQQLGDTCLYFASEAAAQVTGAHLSVDGGWTAW